MLVNELSNVADIPALAWGRFSGAYYSMEAGRLIVFG